MFNLANLDEKVQIAYRRRIKKLKKGDFVNESSASTESDIEERDFEYKRLVSDLQSESHNSDEKFKKWFLRIRDCLAQLYAKDITHVDKQELERFKLHSEQMRVEEHLRLHKMK
ncbi:unnamed protein product [Microthlaspi erraticum]|uniref:Uncharacterized protein n=1 Tax=Microthlaspi erraticum TaxID=1685480 RepID=A0A6D2JBU6_9BRAS|nr:unnamed protein product [Microthlaspi erraticum]